MRVTLTRHARERCAEMGVSTKTIKHAFANEIGTDQPHGGGKPHQRVRIIEQGTLVIPYDPTTREVITVMWGWEFVREENRHGDADTAT